MRLSSESETEEFRESESETKLPSGFDTAASPEPQPKKSEGFESER